MEEVNDQIKQSVSLISAFRFPSANKHCNHSPSGQIQEVDCIVFVIIYLKSMKGKTNSKFTPQIFFLIVLHVIYFAKIPPFST